MTNDFGGDLVLIDWHDFWVYCYVFWFIWNYSFTVPQGFPNRKLRKRNEIVSNFVSKLVFSVHDSNLHSTAKVVVLLTAGPAALMDERQVYRTESPLDSTPPGQADMFQCYKRKNATENDYNYFIYIRGCHLQEKQVFYHVPEKSFDEYTSLFCYTKSRITLLYSYSIKMLQILP